MIKQSEYETQFLGLGMPGCPFVRGNPSRLQCGESYIAREEEQICGFSMIRVIDRFGETLGHFPAQWFELPNHRY